MAITILSVDDEEHARQNIEEFLTPLGYDVVSVGTLKEAREALRINDPDVILLDVTLPDGYGPELLYETANLPVRPPIIIITAHGDIEMAVDAMKNGAHDFLTKPVQLTQLGNSIQRATELIKMRRELSHFRQTQVANVNFVTGSSPVMQDVLKTAQRAANTSVSVLITGETGTGKEVLANYIYKSGPRASKQFIAINCAAIQSTVLESELFGYEAGAFTGADRRKIGLMEVADGGVLFLDEISSMPLDIQAKLLRVIEERALRRVGGTKMIPLDVQIIAASNRPLKELIDKGDFRRDLYFRLKVVDLDLPPLKERKQDIPELVGFFIRHFNSKMGVNIRDISPRAMKALMEYSWPGNIRELSHAIERAFLFCDSGTLEISDFPAELRN